MSAEDTCNKSRVMWDVKDLSKFKPVHWLIPGLIPRSSLTFLVGDEGIGKSALCSLLAGLVTSGRGDSSLGLEPGEPGHVVMLSLIHI